MIPLINEDHIKIEPMPMKDMPNSLFIRVPKLETETEQGVLSSNIFADQDEYPYPPNVTAKDVKGAWIQEI